MTMVTNTPQDDRKDRRLANELRAQAQFAPTDAESRDLIRRAAHLEERLAERAKERERARLLDDLIYRARNEASFPWSIAELRRMDVLEVRRTYRVVFPEQAHNLPGDVRGGFEWARPILGGEPGESVLDDK